MNENQDANDNGSYMQAGRDGEYSYSAWICEMQRRARQREGGKGVKQRNDKARPAKECNSRGNGKSAQHDLSVIDEIDEDGPDEAENTPEIRCAREVARRGLRNVIDGVAVGSRPGTPDDVSAPKEHVDPRASEAYKRLVSWGQLPSEVARLTNELTEYTFEWSLGGERG